MASQTAIVHESIADEFLALISAHSPNVAASATSETDGASLRGLFTETSANRVREIVADALAKGAKVAAGSADVKGNVVQPLLLSGVTSDMRIYKEEMFAPVFSMLTCTLPGAFFLSSAELMLPVQRADKTEEEAIFIANDHDYGLAAAVWTQDTAAGYRIARGINAGMVHMFVLSLASTKSGSQSLAVTERRSTIALRCLTEDGSTVGSAGSTDSRASGAFAAALRGVEADAYYVTGSSRRPRSLPSTLLTLTPSKRHSTGIWIVLSGSGNVAVSGTLRLAPISLVIYRSLLGLFQNCCSPSSISAPPSHPLPRHSPPPALFPSSRPPFSSSLIFSTFLCELDGGKTISWVSLPKLSNGLRDAASDGSPRLAIESSAHPLTYTWFKVGLGGGRGCRRKLTSVAFRKKSLRLPT